MSVRVLFADPDVEVVEDGRDVWVVSGVDTGALRDAIGGAETVDGTIDAVCERAEDAVLVHVERGPSGIRAVDAYRSVVSNFALYYGRSADGVLFLADHYRNAVAQLPAAARTLADTAVTDHLLFRAPIEPTTYLEEIRAVAHGSWVHWGQHATRPSVAQVDRLESDWRGGDDPVSALDEVLGAVLHRGAGGRSVTNMLSGGVDSTLLQTYLDGAPALAIEPDAPELRFEVDYAAESADLLGVRPRRVPLAEADYLDQLETSMDRLGYPSHYGLTPVVDAAFAADPGDRYVNGEGADAVFGLTGIKGFRTALRLEPLLDSPVGGLLCGAPDPVGAYVRELSRNVAQSRRPPSHPRSFAQQFAFFTDPDLAAAIVGDDRVAARARRQFEYVDSRLGSRPVGRYARQLETAQFMSVYHHNTVDQWRQLAYGHGKTVFAPFKTRSVASFALSVPVERRYATDHRLPGQMTVKPLPKRLLNRRLPAYDTGKPKGSGAYPRERFFEDGPLAGVFERYDPPAFVPERLYADHVERYGPLTWNLITFAVWRDRVFENDDLAPVPGTTEVRCDPRVSVDTV